MDDLFKRGCFAAVFLSLGIIGIAMAMEGNGSAGPGNPVWPLISGLRDFFIYAWVLLLGLGAVAGLVALCAQIRLPDWESTLRFSDDQSPKELKLPDFNMPESEEARLEKARRREERLKQEKEEYEKRKLEEAEKEKRRLELRRAKSSEDVIEDALSDF